MSTVTLHRRASGNPDSVRLVEDGFRTSVFLFPPAGLLARGLWLECLLWLALIIAIIAAAIIGAISAGAAMAAIFVIHVLLAIDAPNLERRRLEKRGWPIVALVGPLGATGTVISAPEPPPIPPGFVPSSAPATGVIGLFPGERQ